MFTWKVHSIRQLHNLVAGRTTCFEPAASPIILGSDFASSAVKDSSVTLILLAHEVNESQTQLAEVTWHHLLLTVGSNHLFDRSGKLENKSKKTEEKKGTLISLSSKFIVLVVCLRVKPLLMVTSLQRSFFGLSGWSVHSAYFNLSSISTSQQWQQLLKFVWTNLFACYINHF